MSVRPGILLAKIAVVAAIYAAQACSTDTVYCAYRHAQPAGWGRSDTLVFAVPRVKEAGIYRETVGIRTTGLFPFTGVTLVAEQTIMPGNRVRTDVLKCRLADRNGTPGGYGVSLFQYEFELAEIELHTGDSVNIRIRHDMKREILSGISDVGVKIVIQHS